jgi:TPP-dependent pyruvate/acetoin dehydrogenase alpha subunit
MLDLLAAYRSTYAIRRFEERANELRHTGEITCSVHLCIGQEQVAVCARAALGDADVVLATYRGHHWAIACGVPLDALFAELLGREAGINGGRAGAGLLMAPRYGFLGETGIVGAGPPIAVGAALASRFDGSGRVSLVAFGDGAMNQGAVHEAMNFAAVFDLGVIFVCENNGYSEYTRTEAMFRIERLADRALAYGFGGETVNGSDVVAVHEVVARAADRARLGEGPTLIDVRARRLEGHHTHDPEHYRPAHEKAAWREADPLLLLRRQVVAAETTDEELAELEREVDAANEQALACARSSPPSDPDSVTDHLYA